MPERQKNNGFTLMEAVVALVLVSILIAVAAPRFAGARLGLDTEADILRSHLRYAQSMAMANNVPVWTVNIGANSYSLLKNGTTTSLPGETANIHTFSGGVTATPLTLTIDSLGSPGATDQSITLTGAGRTIVITILGNTGFIQ
jgi:prepilin-type N-terminal cleavage/methylation domain-containing protein